MSCLGNKRAKISNATTHLRKAGSSSLHAALIRRVDLQIVPICGVKSQQPKVLRAVGVHGLSEVMAHFLYDKMSDIATTSKA
jgi:hypothetical protein